MSKQTILIIIGAVVILALVFVFVYFHGFRSVVAPGGGGGEAGPPKPVTREAAPKNVVVPGAGDSSAPKNVAVPQTVSVAAPNRADASFRAFNVSINNGEFEPDTVIVKMGDTARISVTAVDKSYDYFQPDYGFKLTLAKGETKFAQFDATAAGKFKIFCASCGGPDKGPVGYLIVAPKQ